ncbi:hypothetical protein LC612_29805, partial [Nostoc sp. CHAB 5834]|nr:hypothetical protein [Nostoc sp. CHAB 5834]
NIKKRPCRGLGTAAKRARPEIVGANVMLIVVVRTRRPFSQATSFNGFISDSGHVVELFELSLATRGGRDARNPGHHITWIMPNDTNY